MKKTNIFVLINYNKFLISILNFKHFFKNVYRQLDRAVNKKVIYPLGLSRVGSDPIVVFIN